MMRLAILLACLAGAAAIVAATYLHLERAMRREPPWDGHWPDPDTGYEVTGIG